MTAGSPPTLTDPKGMGGIHASEGFDYQLWDGLARTPAWLSSPAFEAIIFEGLEDLEARFFAPQAPQGRLLERFQAKSGDLKPAEVREVLERFHAFDSAYPNLTRVHALVTPRLPSTLRWIARDTSRVRRARPFYSPFPAVVQASDDALRQQLIGEYGATLGGFVADFVDIEERPVIQRDGALQAFASALQRQFPHLDLSTRKSELAFAALEGLARQNIGKALTRPRLVECIESAIGTPLNLDNAVRLLIRSDRGESDDHALMFDASAFSGGTTTSFPPPDVWRIQLREPLGHTARWLRSRAVSRIALDGSYRLSTAFTIGWSFRSAVGFDLDIQTREGPWSTDQHPRADSPAVPWKFSTPERLHGSRLVVAVGILREPAVDEINASLCGGDAQTMLRAYLAQPLHGGLEAQLAVRAVKDRVSAEVGRLGAKGIDLFIAGPAAFGVALGHRWNALPATQLYEYVVSAHRYIPTASLV